MYGITGRIRAQQRAACAEGGTGNMYASKYGPAVVIELVLYAKHTFFPMHGQGGRSTLPTVQHIPKGRIREIVIALEQLPMPSLCGVHPM
jgi:hypothetical protein